MCPQRGLFVVCRVKTESLPPLGPKGMSLVSSPLLSCVGVGERFPRCRQRCPVHKGALGSEERATPCLDVPFGRGSGQRCEGLPTSREDSRNRCQGPVEFSDCYPAT